MAPEAIDPDAAAIASWCDALTPATLVPAESIIPTPPIATVTACVGMAAPVFVAVVLSKPAIAFRRATIDPEPLVHAASAFAPSVTFHPSVPEPDANAPLAMAPEANEPLAAAIVLTLTSRYLLPSTSN